MPSIVQINFDYSETAEALIQGCNDAAPLFTDIAGLRWKVWLGDENTNRAGGLYLFESRAEAEAYTSSALIAHLKNVRTNVDIQVFDTLDAPGILTNAPV